MLFHFLVTCLYMVLRNILDSREMDMIVKDLNDRIPRVQASLVLLRIHWDLFSILITPVFFLFDSHTLSLSCLYYILITFADTQFPIVNYFMYWSFGKQQQYCVLYLTCISQPITKGRSVHVFFSFFTQFSITDKFFLFKLILLHTNCKHLFLVIIQCVAMLWRIGSFH